MWQTRVVKVGTFAFAFTGLLFPTVTAAQVQTGGTIAGVVRDTTGAVLPGVTVEASSAALIEKVRTTTTDAQGQYQLVDLRPGVYSATFTLSGFRTFRREGLQLSGGSSRHLTCVPVLVDGGVA